MIACHCCCFLSLKCQCVSLSTSLEGSLRDECATCPARLGNDVRTGHSYSLARGWCVELVVT